MNINRHPLGSNTENFELHDTFVVDQMNLSSAQPEKLNYTCQQHEYLQDIRIPFFHDNSVTLLLGQDNVDINTPEQAV